MRAAGAIFFTHSCIFVFLLYHITKVRAFGAPLRNHPGRCAITRPFSKLFENLRKTLRKNKKSSKNAHKKNFEFRRKCFEKKVCCGHNHTALPREAVRHLPLRLGERRRRIERLLVAQPPQRESRLREGKGSSHSAQRTRHHRRHRLSQSEWCRASGTPAAGRRRR